MINGIPGGYQYHPASSNPLSHLHLSQSSEGQNEEGWGEQRGMGLIECLMSEESSEIQRLNAQIRLLTIKNEYLRKDNELLSNQIAFLNEKVNQLGNHKQQTRQPFEEMWKMFDHLAHSFQQSFRTKSSSLLQRQERLQKAILQIVESLKESKANQKDSFNVGDQSDKLFKTQIQNQKLMIRVGELQKKLDELSTKYIQTFQWRPYFIPDFTLAQDQTSSMKRPRQDLKLDLRRLSHNSIESNSRIPSEIVIC